MIELIIGGMKSGKSGELFSRMDKLSYSKREGNAPGICLIRPKVDTRDFTARSPIEEKLRNANIFADHTFEKHLSDYFNEIAQYDVICIDEGQFFDDLDTVSFKLSLMGKDVYIAALQGDRNMLPWKSVSDTIPVTDKITQVQAICEFCGDPKKSTFTFYDGPFSESQIVIGDGEFHPACAACWQEHTERKNHSSL